MSESIFKLRKEYRLARLDETDTDANPVRQFRRWFDEALRAELPEPNVMVLSTTGPGNRPSARMVLLKAVNEQGFTFFTNYNSRKGAEIGETAPGALTFFWQELERQVRIEGILMKTPGDVSDEYFAQRPRGSQIGAWASPQSRRIGSRQELEELEREIEKRYKDKPVPRPEYWGGYLLQPDYVEFWQGRESRLHDRICYRLENGSWEKFRLAP